MKKKYAKPRKHAVNIAERHKNIELGDGALKTEVYLDYDAFTGMGMIQLATDLFTLSMDAPVRGKNGLLSTLKTASDKKQKNLTIYKPSSIEICFFPAFAKKLLGWLESELRAKEN